METMLEMSPESFARENVRQGFVKEAGYGEEVVRYYRLFIKGKNAEIDALRAENNALRDENDALRASDATCS